MFYSSEWEILLTEHVRMLLSKPLPVKKLVYLQFNAKKGISLLPHLPWADFTGQTGPEKPKRISYEVLYCL